MNRKRGPNLTTSAEPVALAAALTAIDAVCPRCGGTYRATRELYGTPIPPACEICLEASEELRRHSARNRTREGILQVLSAAGVNVYAYQRATLETFDPAEDPQALEAARSWLEAWEQPGPYPSRPWLVLYGDGSRVDQAGKTSLGAVGNGKTHLGIAIARALLEDGRLLAGRYRFVTVEGFILRSEATFRGTSDQSEVDLLSKFAGYDLLHLDDLGVRDPSPHAMRILDELAKAREGKATIWTSNLSPKVLAQQNEAYVRIVSRMAGECGAGGRFVVPFRGPDRRIQRSRP